MAAPSIWQVKVCDQVGFPGGVLPPAPHCTSAPGLSTRAGLRGGTWGPCAVTCKQRDNYHHLFNAEGLVPNSYQPTSRAPTAPIQGFSTCCCSCCVSSAQQAGKQAGHTTVWADPAEVPTPYTWPSNTIGHCRYPEPKHTAAHSLLSDGGVRRQGIWWEGGEERVPRHGSIIRHHVGEPLVAALPANVVEHQQVSEQTNDGTSFVYLG
jgi:hypothetical protein